MNNIKSNEIEDSDSFRYGIIFKCLRLAQDKSIKEIARNLSTTNSYLSMIENGYKNPTIISFMSLCKAYNIKPSEFMQIAEEIDSNNLSFKEVFLLCAKYESNKCHQSIPADEKETDKKFDLILKSMRVTQGKDLSEVAKEISITVNALSPIENGIRIPSIKTFKKYIKFFDMPDEDFEKLYCEVISKNLTYPQILYYCLVYDIERQKKLNLENRETLQSNN